MLTGGADSQSDCVVNPYEQGWLCIWLRVEFLQAIMILHLTQHWILSCDDYYVSKTHLGHINFCKAIMILHMNMQCWMPYSQQLYSSIFQFSCMHSRIPVVPDTDTDTCMETLTHYASQLSERTSLKGGGLQQWQHGANAVLWYADVGTDALSETAVGIIRIRAIGTPAALLVTAANGAFRYVCIFACDCSR